jgi:dienelactone hydrolase
LTFDAALVDNSLRVKANGELRGFDPAAISGKPALKGEVGGTVDVDATLRGISNGVTPDSMETTGRIDLQPSMIGGVTIDSAVIDGDYRDSTGVIRTLDVKGHDVNLTATGTFALNETGQSNATFHADTTSLDEIGKLVDKPLHGIATVDGTLTGNRRELQATGHLMANDVAHGETRALTMSTDYAVKVPDLAVERATVNADTAATFVTVAGQNINELQAKTQYENKRLIFDATARQPRRSLGAAGSLLLHPDHQEMHLQQLDLQAQGANWELAPGSEAAIRYGDNAIAVQNVKLVSGNQQIAADGTFGHPGDALSVSLTHVDLASVDAMLLRPPQLTGRLNASSTITGTQDAPHVKADFQVNEGGFRQFRYDMLSGTADYAGKGITLDARLQQNPTTWATAKGYVVIAPEYRGSIGYGKEFYDAIDYGGNEVDDVVTAVDVLKGKYPQVDPSRIGIMGWSHGGMITLLSIFRNPARFKAAVAMVPVTNLFQRLAWKGVERQKQMIDPQNRYGGLPFERREVYKDRSPLYGVDKLQIPLYVAVAKNDDDVNIEEDMQLVDALRSRKSALAETMVYDDPPGGHTFDRRVDPKTWQPENTREQRDSWNRVWTFLDWNLDPFHDSSTSPVSSK